MEGCNLKRLKQELHKTTNRLKATKAHDLITGDLQFLPTVAPTPLTVLHRRGPSISPLRVENIFQYSSSHSVAEVNRASYQGCNTTNVLQPSSNGNTTFALTKPGDRYFVCGNRLHCYAGMKLHVVVDGKTADGRPRGGTWR
ncbi:hypothetical protein E3N88_12837 [Mikania micrantha]|uniref:Phytocyanin domain-containing protein n=1 Tax=Mikania micrantha TaxID=192012 RepID=A0A5N6P7Y0_9ASTR|nr:hypothetical protein E3N88_12837 [Mikania micrantha]